MSIVGERVFSKGTGVWNPYFHLSWQNSTFINMGGVCQSPYKRDQVLSDGAPRLSVTIARLYVNEDYCTVSALPPNRQVVITQ